MYTQDLKTKSQTFTSGIEIPIFCTEQTSKTINSNRKLGIEQVQACTR